MATQWTAQGITSGAVLPAATLQSIGAATVNYTPTFTQSVNISKTVNFARYWQFQKLVVVQFSLTATSNGTAGNAIVVGLPLTASGFANLGMGVVGFAGGAGHYGNKIGTCYGNNSSSIAFLMQDGVSNLFGINPSFQILSGDTITATFMYEVA